MLKRGLLTIAASALTTLGASNKNIAFNAPVRWATYRSSAVQVQFVTDSTLYNKEIQLTVRAVDGSNKKVLAKKKVTINTMGNKVDFPALAKNGVLHYAIDWSVKGTDAAGSVEPFSIAKLSKETVSEEIVSKSKKGQSLSVDGLLKNKTYSFNNLGSASVALLSNENVCALILKKSDEPVTLAFDPANSKDGFLAFSHRFVTIDSSGVSFSYEKKSFKESAVQYTAKQWYGQMSSGSNDEYTAIVIPWSDLGVKYKSGRRVGFALLQGSGSYPAKADKTVPATWKNIKIQ